MHPLKTTSAALAGVAVLALIAVQFAPWTHFENTSSSPGFDFGGFSSPGFTFTAKLESFTWNLKQSVNGDSDTTSWYDGDMDDSDGIGMIRTAVPMLLVGTIVVLVGALLGAARGGSTGAIITMIGGLVLAVAVTLFAIGQDQFYDTADYDWSASFYLAITAGTLALVGGVLGLVAGNTNESNATF